MRDLSCVRPETQIRRRRRSATRMSAHPFGDARPGSTPCSASLTDHACLRMWFKKSSKVREGFGRSRHTADVGSPRTVADSDGRPIRLFWVRESGGFGQTAFGNGFGSGIWSGPAKELDTRSDLVGPSDAQPGPEASAEAARCHASHHEDAVDDSASPQPPAQRDRINNEAEQLVAVNPSRQARAAERPPN